MKILHVITSLRIGGAEKLMVDLLPKMRDLGNEVELLCFDGASTSFMDSLRQTGLTIHVLGNNANVYHPIYLWRLFCFLKKNKYDIVHTHNTAPQLFAAISSVLCSVVLVTTEHNTSNRRRDWTWYRLIDRWMYSRYKSIISISPATTSELKKHVSINSPIYTIPNGIDVFTYSAALALPREIIKCRENAFLVMMLAGFRSQKDQDTLIRAMKLLPDNVQLCLVGDGERRTICEELAKELHIDSQVVFAGIRSDVPKVLKTADIVVMSSHYEGFGLAALEGMAACKPVIASDVSGLAEVVKDAGILFPQGDERHLAHEIKHLMSDRTYYDCVAQKCKQRASKYDIQKMLNAYIDVYEKQ